MDYREADAAQFTFCYKLSEGDDMLYWLKLVRK